jgi:Domain of unknown function (DUF4157)
MAFALLSRSRSKPQGSVKPAPKQKSAREQHSADSRFGFAKSVFQPQTAALPTAPVIQTKLKVGEPDDKFEEEADRVAELEENGNSSISPSAAAQSRNPVGNLQPLYGNRPVLRMRQGLGDPLAPAVLLRPSQGGILQRKCACGGAAGMSGKCEECGKKTRLGLQTKLKVSEPGDIYEQEADRIADQVMAAPAHPAVSGAPPRIQRLAAQPTGQADAAPASVDQALASPGRPLESALRQDMEQRFGHDFSRVRVHTDARAAESARAANALAYTVGRDVVFGAGRYAPGTTEGDRLLAHELTHVVQQTKSPVPFVQRDKGGAPPQTKIEPRESKESAAMLAQMSEIERRWAQVKSIASGFAETKGWISKGDAVIALILDHEDSFFKAIDAHDAELAAAYKILRESDIVAYRYVAWHAFVYQNLLRVRAKVDSLVSSFDADKRDFTGRKFTEERVRALKGLINIVGRDSAATLAELITDHPFKFRAGSANEILIMVTSAADKNKRAALEKETAKIKYIQVMLQAVLDNANEFLRNAMREGFWQAVEAVKEYYMVRQGILDSDEGPEPEKQEEKKEEKKKQRTGRGDYQCTAKCQQQCPAGVEGWVEGVSNKNCAEATQNAKSTTRRGCYPRHCNCKDTDGFIGTGTACENHTR